MKRDGTRGALLVEILAASFILSVGLLAVIGVYIQVGRAERALGHQEQAACFAGDGMEQLRNWGSMEWSAENLADAADPAWMEKDGVQYERQTTLRPRPDLDSMGQLVEAEVRVKWSEKSQICQVVLVTYFAVNDKLKGMR